MPLFDIFRTRTSHSVSGQQQASNQYYPSQYYTPQPIQQSYTHALSNQQIQQQTVLQQQNRRETGIDALQKLINNWTEYGFKINTISVSRETFEELGRYNLPPATYACSTSEFPSTLKEIKFHTYYGYITIVCEDDKPLKFDLDKYMETV